MYTFADFANSPGVHVLQDSRTGVFNFDPELSPIPTPDKFAFHRTPQYITPSQDSVSGVDGRRCRKPPNEC
jgi:hypothetical protein